MVQNLNNIRPFRTFSAFSDSIIIQMLMLSFNSRFNNRNGQSSRVSSPASFAGTPWSRRVPTILASSSPGHGVGASGTTRLNLPIDNIIECNGNLISIMSNAVKTTQDLKNQLLSTCERDPFSMLPMKFSVSMPQERSRVMITM